MNTQLFVLHNEDSKVFTEIISLWEAGELVAFPTETVYGLGGNGLDAAAARKIYAAKGRPSDNPLILHIGERSQLAPLVSEISEKAEKLMDAFWPGPLTIIFKKSALVPYETTGGLETVAIRMPSFPVANELLKACPFPIAAPSANLSGRPSPTRIQHVVEDMEGRIAGILDGGDVPIGVESTIVDMTTDIPVLLRPGYITVEEMEKVIGPVETDPAILNTSIIHHTNAVEHPKAPGMKYRHYAPKAPVTIVHGDAEKVAEAILRNTNDATGIITVEEHRHLYTKGKVIVAGSLENPASIAHNLFDVLRTFDAISVEKIYSEDFSTADIGTAIMNRLLKAAGGSYVSADEI